MESCSAIKNGDGAPPAEITSLLNESHSTRTSLESLFVSFGWKEIAKAGGALLYLTKGLECQCREVAFEVLIGEIHRGTTCLAVFECKFEAS